MIFLVKIVSHSKCIRPANPWQDIISSMLYLLKTRNIVTKSLRTYFLSATTTLLICGQQTALERQKENSNTSCKVSNHGLIGPFVATLDVVYKGSVDNLIAAGCRIISRKIPIAKVFG